MGRRGIQFAMLLVVGAVGALIYSAITAGMLGPLTGFAGDLLGMTGVTGETNTCELTFDRQSGGTTCEGDINNCEIINESGLCTDVGCSWNTSSSRCYMAESDSPDCENVGADRCKDIPLRPRPGG